MLKYISRVFARQIVRRIAIIATGALFMLAPALLGGLHASAASAYDDVWRNANELDLRVDDYYGVTCEPVSALEDWVNIALDSEHGDQDWKNSFRSALNGDLGIDQGRWGVSEFISDEGSNGSYKGYSIYWTENDSLYLDWRTDHVAAGGSTFNAVSVIPAGAMYGSDSYCDEVYLVENTGGVASSVHNWTGETDRTYRNLFINVDSNMLNIPQGYDGDPIRNAPPSAGLTDEQYAPDWTILTANNWKAEIRDYRFTTFDGIPWTCSEDGNSLIQDSSGLAPVIEWELLNENNTVIDEGVLSATAHWNYQFDEHNVDTTYTIKGRYDCGGSVNFAVVGEKQFTITKTGVLKEQDFFAKCIMTEPPFIDVPACIDNVFRVIEILSFNQVILVSGLEASENCRQLQVLGHWINKPYEVVCPQFSPTVRNTVTPFVTFILGLFTAMIIVRFLNNRGMS